MIVDQKTGKAFANLWFGNFYRPAYDDEEFVRRAVALMKELGFNSALLDSKDWEDFRARFAGGEASQYVKMQEFMQETLLAAGLSYDFLALYLNGDNLYPNIRFSAPVYGESVTAADGSDGRWYRYWSPKARSTMAEHVAQLLRLYGEGQTCVAVSQTEERRPLCSMWDPIVAPSFDAEGRARYLRWLSKRYQGDIAALNSRYGLHAAGFDALRPEEYWFALRYPERTAFTEEEAKERAVAFWVLADNRLWQRDELVDYFKDMQTRLHGIDPSLWLCPDLTQWGYFLNVDGAMLSGVGMADLWDTAVRGIDLYRLAPYVDCTSFISVPVTPEGDPDIYVTGCHHSMLRCMNRGREFLGGIYWGRFLYNHLYETITPCETVATMVASGAGGYTSYGMCGLDDGGVLHRMEPYFNASLARANAWMQEVLPLLGRRAQAEAAILFPSSMALCESMRTAHNRERRLDLLGWYHACLDLGVDADVISADLARPEVGAEHLEALCQMLRQYRVLIIPADDCYELERRPLFEEALRRYVREGGTVIHGPHCALARLVFGVREEAQEAGAAAFDLDGEQEACLIQSTAWVSYPDEAEVQRGSRAAEASAAETQKSAGKSAGQMEDGAPAASACVLARWRADGSAAMRRQPFGAGSLVSVGFDYGYCYTAKTAPHVPRTERNNELYPLTMLRKNPLAAMLAPVLGRQLKLHRNIEKVRFANGLLVINHTSYPHKLEETGERAVYQYPGEDGVLAGHSAVFLGDNSVM